MPSVVSCQYSSNKHITAYRIMMNKHMARDYLSPTLSDWKVGGAGVT